MSGVVSGNNGTGTNFAGAGGGGTGGPGDNVQTGALAVADTVAVAFDTLLDLNPNDPLAQAVLPANDTVVAPTVAIPA